MTLVKCKTKYQNSANWQECELPQEYLPSAKGKANHREISSYLRLPRTVRNVEVKYPTASGESTTMVTNTNYGH